MEPVRRRDARPPGAEPSLRARYLLELGLLRSGEGKYAEALAPLREAVALRRAARPKDRNAGRAELVEPLGSLGMVLHRNGDYEPAGKIYEEALALGRRELGAEHPEVASMIQRLGNLRFDQGRFEDSVAHSRQALAIREKVLGPEHHQVGSSLTSLGNALSEAGRPAEALSCYERALAIQRRTFGEISPSVAVTLNNIANVYLKQRRFDLAERQFGQVVEIRTKTLGAEHPSTALALHNLGFALDRSGRPVEALGLFRKSLAISERALGADHPTIVGNPPRHRGRRISRRPPGARPADSGTRAQNGRRRRSRSGPWRAHPLPACRGLAERGPRSRPCPIACRTGDRRFRLAWQRRREAEGRGRGMACRPDEKLTARLGSRSSYSSTCMPNSITRLAGMRK